MRKDIFKENPPAAGHSPALKELAGRLHNLSFRDMQTFANLLDATTNEDMADALLTAADKVLGK